MFYFGPNRSEISLTILVGGLQIWTLLMFDPNWVQTYTNRIKENIALNLIKQSKYLYNCMHTS